MSREVKFCLIFNTDTSIRKVELNRVVLLFPSIKLKRKRHAQQKITTKIESEQNFYTALFVSFKFGSIVWESFLYHNLMWKPNTNKAPFSASFSEDWWNQKMREIFEHTLLNYNATQIHLLPLLYSMHITRFK